MAQAFLNNYIFYLDGDLNPGDLSVAITTDVESNSVVIITDPADLTLISDDGKSVERMIITAAANLMTISLRWIKADASGTVNPALQKKWYAWQRCFVTIFASHLITNSIFSSNNTWTGTNTFTGPTNISNLNITGTSIPRPIFADAAARNIAIPAPIDWQHCRILSPAPVDQVYNGTTLQWEDYGIWTPPPMATTTAAWLVKIATSMVDPDQFGGVYNMPTISMVTSQVTNILWSSWWLVTDNPYMLWEVCTAWQCLFLETWPVTWVATNKQNISNASWNTRISFPVIWTWVTADTFKVNICKTGTWHNANQHLHFRIETDNAGNPSWTLIDPNAIADIAASALTTSLVDTPLIFTWWSGTDAHWVTLNVTEATQRVLKWVKVTLSQQTSVLSVDKDSDCTATKAYLYDLVWNLLATATFIANVATFNYSGFVYWASYYIVCGSDWASYTSVKQTGSASYPYNKTKFNYVWWTDLFRWYTNTSTKSYNNNSTPTATIQITALADCYIYEVPCVSYSSVLLKDSSWVTTLATPTIALGKATFTPYKLTAWVTYRIVMTGAPWYWASMNIIHTVWTDIEILTSQMADSSQAEPPFYVKTATINEDNTTAINNIVDINYSVQFSIPLGTKAHIVARQWSTWNYADTIINAFNYYNIWYSTNNTTIRWLKSYDGASWNWPILVDSFPWNAINPLTWNPIVSGGANNNLLINNALVFMFYNYINAIEWSNYVKSLNTYSWFLSFKRNAIISGSAGWYNLTWHINIYQEWRLYWDATNYIEIKPYGIWAPNAVYNGGVIVKVVVWWVTTYTTTVVAACTDFKIDYNPVNGEIKMYYYTSSRQQIWVTQTNIFSWNPYLYLWNYWNSTVAYTVWTITTNAVYLIWTTFTELNPVYSSWLFPYVSSTLFQNQLLSLADADYQYKSNVCGVSSESKTIWQYPILTLKWINNWFTGLIAWHNYYLGQTPGSVVIDTPPTTNICFIGKAWKSNLLDINYGAAIDATITPGSIYYTSTWWIAKWSFSVVYWSVQVWGIMAISVSNDWLTFVNIALNGYINGAWWENSPAGQATIPANKYFKIDYIISWWGTITNHWCYFMPLN